MRDLAELAHFPMGQNFTIQSPTDRSQPLTIKRFDDRIYVSKAYGPPSFQELQHAGNIFFAVEDRVWASIPATGNGPILMVSGGPVELAEK